MLFACSLVMGFRWTHRRRLIICDWARIKGMPLPNSILVFALFCFGNRVPQDRVPARRYFELAAEQ
jgi:hypothetical protein